MCLYPKTMRNPKYKPNKTNKGIVPDPTDIRALTIETHCGECEECRKELQNKWYQRLSNHLKVKSGKLATFTFTDEAINELTVKYQKKYNTTEKPDANDILSLAFKLYSNRYLKKYKVRPKGFWISELGSKKVKRRKDGTLVKGTERIHFHAIIFTEVPEKEIQKLWKYGNIDFGKYCNERTINYILKYVTKIDEEHLGYKPIIRASQKMGTNYLKTWDAEQNRYKTNGETNTTYRNPSGNRTGLNKYYRDKLYTDLQREDIRMKKLDEGIKYINGKKYDYKTEQQKINFEKNLEYFRQENIRKGYGDRSEKFRKRYYPPSNKH